MNLKVRLLLQILLVAMSCLLVTGAYVLYQTNRLVKGDALKTLDSVVKYLDMQRIRINANLQDAHHFPDFDLWKQAHGESGVCLHYLSANQKTSYGICQGERSIGKRWPDKFEQLYKNAFHPGLGLTRTLSLKGLDYGSITVTTSSDKELAMAWDRLTGLLGLSASSTVAVSLLVYISIYRALRPANLIVSTLQAMQSTEVVSPLPVFKQREWHCIGMAINTFAETQKQLLTERKNLVLQVISVQEEERRFLARELHDEFGQCLSAINALASAILQTARQDCPSLVPEIEQIAFVNQHIMTTLRTLLVRLRPAELDEWGLAVSLESLVGEWNKQQAKQKQCQLIIEGDAQQLLKPLPITLYRICQEALTNVAKHSNAKQALISLQLTDPTMLSLTIQDNGTLPMFPFAKHHGLGLLGVRERVNGLGGTFELSKNESGGLTLTVTFPKPCLGDAAA